MRKTMTMILLASAAALPAIAQADPGDGRGSPRGGWQRPLDRGGDGRGQQSQQNRAEVRNDRAEVRQDRREISRDRQEVQQDRSQMRQDWRAGNPATARQDWRETQRDRFDAGADRRDLRQDQRETWRDRRAIANGVANSPAEQRRDWRANGRDDRRDWRDNQRNWQDNRRDWRNDNDRRDNDHRWVDNRDWGRRDNDWNRDWRRDRRYDWQGWRYQNRSRFHLRQYYAPRGYRYNRWYVGYRLDPWFYASDYWISDPFYYRLPAAYGPYRWVRYFDDVMLIDIRDGRIVDIIYDFFW